MKFHLLDTYDDIFIQSLTSLTKIHKNTPKLSLQNMRTLPNLESQYYFKYFKYENWSVKFWKVAMS